MELLSSKWVNNCSSTEPDPATEPAYEGLGLNFAMLGSQNNLTKTVVQWRKSAAYYHYDTNTCDQGKDCSSYIKVTE